jgi:predicted nuclease of predicted toxin-antitoxin system
MKFIVDAQLPHRLVHELTSSGHDAIHTLDLPAANRTPDNDILAIAIQQQRIVVTKDNDFVTSFLLRGAPPKLLLISTGNISNDKLSQLLAGNLSVLQNAFLTNDFVELSASAITIHS